MENLFKIVSIICAAVLFISVLNLPPEYFRVLRVIVFIGAIIKMTQNYKNIHWIIVFALIGLLFNPIYPIYLYQKSKWIPIDILVGLLFLVHAFFQKKEEKIPSEPKTTEEKTYGRDRIH